MNDFVEEPDVPTPASTPSESPSPAAEPPAAPPPTYAAQPQPAASYAVPPLAARRAPGLQQKSPFIACVLSLMPGVGQIYLGYYKLGFIHNVVFASTIMLLTTRLPDPMYPLLGISLAFFFIYNIVDAGRRAVYYNLALDGVEGIELPNMQLAVPSFGGSFGGGLALVGIGIVLLSNTLLGFSLNWFEEWWPVAPIALGGYLIWKAIQERSAT
jgi:hypothetical protein